jgi:hypothetical protein
MRNSKTATPGRRIGAAVLFKHRNAGRRRAPGASCPAWGPVKKAATSGRRKMPPRATDRQGGGEAT